MVFAVINLIKNITKLCLIAYFGYRFLMGDKEKMETIWYGIATVLLVI